MAESFTDVAARTAAFSDMLSEYLGECIEPHHPIPGSEYNATDGSLLCRVGGPAASSAARLLPVYIQVVKLEVRSRDGSGSHACVKAPAYLCVLLLLPAHSLLPCMYARASQPDCCGRTQLIMTSTCNN